MCLAVPGKVLEVQMGEPWALVESCGLIRRVGIHLVGETLPGEYLLVHAGYAITKLEPAEAAKSMRLLEELLDAEPG